MKRAKAQVGEREGEVEDEVVRKRGESELGGKVKAGR